MTLPFLILSEMVCSWHEIRPIQSKLQTHAQPLILRCQMPIKTESYHMIILWIQSHTTWLSYQYRVILYDSYNMIILWIHSHTVWLWIQSHTTWLSYKYRVIPHDYPMNTESYHMIILSIQSHTTWLSYEYRVVLHDHVIKFNSVSIIDDWLICLYHTKHFMHLCNFANGGHP